MLAKTLICMNCGNEGEIEFQGVNRNVPSSKIFRHLGHNPLSGHLHYQCPACAMVLLIDPMAIPADGIPALPYERPSQKTADRTHSRHVPQMLSMFQKIAQNLQTGN